MDDLEHGFTEEVKNRLLSTSLKLLENRRSEVAKAIAERVSHDIKDTLRGRKPQFQKKLEVHEDDTMKIGAYTLDSKNEFEPIRQFVLQEEKAKGNTDVCKKIVEFENEYYNLRKIFEDTALSLIRQVQNGTPMRGKCGLCPKVKVISTRAEINKIPKHQN
ncbi:hypothetical protein KAS14_03805 [Candidatus Bathyarchaeota archaeon]|nr:hypothetical protein [Candidatus Bathyarchaeota archaeon]